MTIHIDNKKIEDVYYGKQVIQQIFYGQDLVYCRNIVLTINATPNNAHIEWTVDGKKFTDKSITVKKGQTVSYKVSAEGYWWEADTFVASHAQTFDIILRRSDFPREWGKYIKGVATCIYNSTKSDWEYGWALHFEKGTLPVEVWRGLTTFGTKNIHYDWFSTDVNSNFNSAIMRFADNKWLPAIARDEENYMAWRNSKGEAIGALLYSTAATWNWNDGVNTVYTDKFVFSINDNILKIKKSSAEFANFAVVV